MCDVTINYETGGVNIFSTMVLKFPQQFFSMSSKNCLWYHFQSFHFFSYFKNYSNQFISIGSYT